MRVPDFDVFQAECAKTAIYRETMHALTERVSYTALGLASEAGEVSGKVKKVFRDDGGYFTYDSAKEICHEVGDVLWYCAMLLDELNYSFSVAAEGVVNKLKARAERGTLHGSGDNR